MVLVVYSAVVVLELLKHDLARALFVALAVALVAVLFVCTRARSRGGRELFSAAFFPGLAYGTLQFVGASHSASSIATAITVPVALLLVWRTDRKLVAEGAAVSPSVS